MAVHRWLSLGVGGCLGASGVLHAIMGAGAARRDWDRWLLLACLAGKLACEQLGLAEPAGVVVAAHLYGAAWGLSAGAALCARMAIIRLRKRPRVP